VDASLDQVVGQKFWETPWWTHLEELQADLQTWIERAGSGTPVRYEADHQSHRGEAVTVDGILQPVTDDDGTVTGILAVGRDITARQRLQETLERREESLRRLHETLSASDPSFEEKIEDILSIARDRLGVNFGFLTSIDDGVQTVEAAQGSHLPITPGDTFPLSEAYCRRTVERDDLLAFREISGEEWRDDTARDRFDWGSYIGSKVTVDGELYGTLCFSDPAPRERQFTDDERTYVELLTQWVSFELERVRYQRDLQRQNERLEEFASALSHDLRNPLTAAAGYLDLARSAENPEQHLDDVEVMHDRMAELVDDVLAVARNGGDVDPADVDDVSLADVAAKAWTTANTGDATLRTDAADAVLRCDEGRLRQLLENLFRNAVEHGTAESRSSADSEKDRGDDVTVRVAATVDGFVVADDGAGIPPEVRDDVFERGFSTSDDSTGFGLTIVREIAEAHHWTVTDGESGPAVSDDRDESEPSGDDPSGGARFAFGNVEFA
jgi:PAS domain S-box-containing protein